MEIKLLQYPNIRNEIKVDIKILFDLTYQEKYWLNNITNNYGNFDMFMEGFINGLNLCHLDRVLEYLNIALYNEDEAKAVANLGEKILDLCEYELKSYDFNLYINNPKWLQVVEKAKVLYQLMLDNDEKYNFQACFKAYEEEGEGWYAKFDN